MLIDANHLKLTLNGRAVLQDVSMHMEAGEIYGLLGPNGAGKSTSIAVLFGLYPLDEGQLRLFGETRVDAMAMRRRIGVMPENAGFYEWMSAKDYLSWYAGFYSGLQQPVSGLSGSGRPARQRRPARRAVLPGHDSSDSPWPVRWSRPRSS